jgi:hypothetical protein
MYWTRPFHCTIAQNNTQVNKGHRINKSYIEIPTFKVDNSRGTSAMYQSVNKKIPNEVIVGNSTCIEKAKYGHAAHYR